MRRPKRSVLGRCACGSEWFSLRCADAELEGVAPAGAVTIDEHGMITGHSGELQCLDCGEVWRPSRSRLRLVVEHDD